MIAYLAVKEPRRTHVVEGETDGISHFKTYMNVQFKCAHFQRRTILLVSKVQDDTGLLAEELLRPPVPRLATHLIPAAPWPRYISPIRFSNV